MKGITKRNKRVADLAGKITFVGKRKESIQRVYDLMAPRSRNLINDRTGKPFTILGTFSVVGSEHDFTGYCTFSRLGIVGNYPNDVEEFVEKIAAKENVRVRCDLKRVVREEWA